MVAIKSFVLRAPGADDLCSHSCIPYRAFNIASSAFVRVYCNKSIMEVVVVSLMS